ncbi:MAG: hypothetical protein JSR37_05760 [Verrucomicrobia bacterium]|nr:hypothetical protein [Verrucomicrobiota bacterium]
MNKNTPLTVAGIVFALVALLHLARLYFQFPIIVDQMMVPYWINGVGLVVAAFLSIWMFRATKN